MTAAVERAREAAPYDPWALADCAHVLAELYVGQGRAAEAESLYRSAAERLERAAGEAPRATAQCLASLLPGLAALCRSSGRESEAAALEERATTLAHEGL